MSGYGTFWSTGDLRDLRWQTPGQLAEMWAMPRRGLESCEAWPTRPCPTVGRCVSVAPWSSRSQPGPPGGIRATNTRSHMSARSGTLLVIDVQQAFDDPTGGRGTTRPPCEQSPSPTSTTSCFSVTLPSCLRSPQEHCHESSRGLSPATAASNGAAGGGQRSRPAAWGRIGVHGRAGRPRVAGLAALRANSARRDQRIPMASIVASFPHRRSHRAGDA